MIKSRKILDSWYKTFFYGGWTTENGTVRLNKEYETIDKDLDRLEKIKMWFENIDKFNIRDKYYAIPKDFIDLVKVVLEDEK